MWGTPPSGGTLPGKAERSIVAVEECACELGDVRTWRWPRILPSINVPWVDIFMPKPRALRAVAYGRLQVFSRCHSDVGRGDRAFVRVDQMMR